MRSLSTGVRVAVTLFTLLVVLTAPAAYGDDGNPYETPAGRIMPPTGLTSQAKIMPPGGATSVEPTFIELLMEWLHACGRILPAG